MAARTGSATLAGPLTRNEWADLQRLAWKEPPETSSGVRGGALVGVTAIKSGTVVIDGIKHNVRAGITSWSARLPEFDFADAVGRNCRELFGIPDDDEPRHRSDVDNTEPLTRVAEPWHLGEPSWRL